MFCNLCLVLVLLCGSTFYFGNHLAEEEKESWLLYVMCVLALVHVCYVPTHLPYVVMGWSVIVAFPDHIQ